MNVRHHARRMLGVACVASALLWSATGPAHTEESGMAAANKKVVDAIYEEVLNGRNMDAAGKFLAEELLEAVAKEVSDLTGALPDANFRIVGLVAEGDRVALLGELTGTHTEPGWGMPATGKPVNMRYADVYRFDGGKVAEAWHVVNSLRAMQQLGVIPGADGADPAGPPVEAGPAIRGDSESTEALKAVVRRAIEDVSGKGDASAVDELYSPEYVFHDPDTTESVGLEGVKERMGTIHSISSNALITVEDMVAEGHLVAVRWSMSGTHNGSGLMGIPATGQDFWGDIISFYRIADGKIVEGWMVVDALAMMEQLGIMPGE